MTSARLRSCFGEHSEMTSFGFDFGENSARLANFGVDFGEASECEFGEASQVDNIQYLRYSIIRGELIMVYRMLEYFLIITLILHCHGGMLHYAWY